MLISEAFDSYQKNYMVIRHQSIRILETHGVCRRSLIETVGDKDMADLTIEDVSRWVKSLQKNRCLNTVRNNGNMRYLSAMLGHASLDTTMMYAHVVDNDLQMQYEKYHTI